MCSYLSEHNDDSLGHRSITLAQAQKLFVEEEYEKSISILRITIALQLVKYSPTLYLIHAIDDLILTPQEDDDDKVEYIEKTKKIMDFIATHNFDEDVKSLLPFIAEEPQQTVITLMNNLLNSIQQDTIQMKISKLQEQKQLSLSESTCEIEFDTIAEPQSSVLYSTLRNYHPQLLDGIPLSFSPSSENLTTNEPTALSEIAKEGLIQEVLTQLSLQDSSSFKEPTLIDLAKLIVNGPNVINEVRQVLNQVGDSPSFDEVLQNVFPLFISALQTDGSLFGTSL
eukprot:TRINITY_DN2427_c0_g1_i3.p1 TRINITY_DN2427_c0_g1~~TRINITY_DN2427_c0_g1_i3.p1  ORF type:complete len:283 (+),score=63.78 TRINITY_DN2427_c0_g1_i3:206-1054(+)